MSSKVLIPLLVIVPILLIVVVIGGSASYFLYQVNSKNTSVNSTTQKSSLSSETKKATTSISSKSALGSKLLTVNGTINANVKISENLPKLCLEGNTEKYCNPKISIMSPTKFAYEFTNIINNIYELTYSYKDEIDSGFAELPDSGVLNNANTDFEPANTETEGEINNIDKIKIDVSVEKFKQLSEQKKAKVKMEFGSRAGCIKQSDYFYKCSEVTKPN